MKEAPSARERSRLGIEALQSFYDTRSGLWRTTGWWNAANALHCVVDFMEISGDGSYADVVANTFARHSSGGFINDFYDDEGWWALTWLAAYRLLEDRAYLRMAQSIFEDMCSGWDDVCGGGIWWNKSRQYKNAIANELFLKLSARLYGVTEHPKYRDWAVTAWRWFSTTGLINAQHLVNDGLTTDCRNNGKPAWSYNQGVILGALVALRETEALVDQTPLDEAKAIADAALSILTDAQGILREPVEGDLGDDGPQFKGIFVRNLAELAATVPAPHYRAFLIRNADTIWERNRDPGNRFGAFWAGPFDRADAARQSAAIDCFNAASSLEFTSV